MKFPPHVLNRMAQRQVTKKQVLQTVNRPEKSEQAKYGRTKSQKEFRIKGERKVLKVVWKQTRKEIIIITACWR